MMPMAFYCKSCGYELSDPSQDLHDPEGLSDIAESLGENPRNKDAHLQVKDGPKGWRFYCSENGQVTSIMKEPPKDEGEGEGQPPPQSQDTRANPKADEVYDIDEEKGQMEVLKEVIENPIFDLSDAQKAEIVDWADDYGGALPPNELENILKNFSGVAKQTAELARRKYETKLDKWVREQNEDNGGPPIGVGRRPASAGGQGSTTASPSDTSRPTPNRPPSKDDTRRESRTDDGVLGNRDRRRQRRAKAADKAVENMADEATREIGGLVGDLRDAVGTALKRKAEKDPDWFTEKMDEYDMDIVEALIEPSDARKKEMRKEKQPAVDRKADEALESVKDNGTETPKSRSPQEEPEPQQDVMTAGPQERGPEEQTGYDEQDEDDEFDAVFGEENRVE